MTSRGTRGMAATMAATSLLAGGAEAGAPDLVLRNARVVTLDAARPAAEAFAVSAGRFTAVGDAASIEKLAGPATRLVDARGAVIVPGLIDAHLHLVGEGFRRLRLDLVGTTSKEQVLEAVREAARAQPEGGVLRGRGWDQNDWPVKEFPTAADLDAVVSDRPVVLQRIDGHAVWVNSKALALGGVGPATADPAGGRIERGPRGAPSGVLVDNAGDLVLSRLPPRTPAEIRRAVDLAARAALAAGLTGIHEPGLDLAEIAVLKEMCARGDLKLRVYVMVNPGEALERYLASGPEIGLCGGRLTVRALKLYADGALGSRGAALLEEYADEPGNRGLLTTPVAALERDAGRAARAGLQPCIHAIGDRGNHEVLDLFERLAARVEGFAARRPRIEHAQLVAVADLPRFARLGVIASMQPTHATSDMPWVERRVGKARLAGAYAWKRLLRGGAALAFGSDAPVESLEPLLGLYAARTRQDASGQPEGGFEPQERLDGEEALRAFTLGAARAAFEERDKGSIEVGKLADFVLLPGDPRRVAPAELLRMKVLATWIGGETVFEAGK